ncbi:MAG: cobyrinate a,c-diamide synthase [Eubacteriales bacterium]
MQRLINLPRLVIAAPQGRSGKTTVSVGLMAALVARGLTVQAFKKGPDYIDPSWLTKVTGRQCRNLDCFLMEREDLRESFARNAKGAGISVIEGAMGIFDGVDLEGSGSTAEVAKALEAPVLLVVNTARMTRSVAAMVMGFQKFDPAVNIAGVILNNVAKSRHENMLRAAVEKYCGLPVLGAMPKGTDFRIPDRHLGLIPAAENEELHRAVEALGETAARHLDIDAIIGLAGSSPPLPEAEESRAKIRLDDRNTLCPEGYGRPVIGVFFDRAFTFYYPENLEALAFAGASILPLDSLSAKSLPDIDALYIGGGFPEVFAAELEANFSLRRAVRDGIEEGLPVYAECGGLMYLGRTLTWRGRAYEMCGALPFDVVMSEKPQGHGYVVAEVVGENRFFEPGRVIRGHEFHHSRLINLDLNAVRPAYRILRGHGIDGDMDGLVYKNVLAGYTHLHAVSHPDWAARLVQQADKYRQS